MAEWWWDGGEQWSGTLRTGLAEELPQVRLPKMNPACLGVRLICLFFCVAVPVLCSAQSSAFEHFEEGRKKANRGDYDRALPDLDRAIALDPNLSEAWVVRSGVRAAKGDWEGAWSDSERGIALAPKSSRPYHARGYLKWIKGDNAGGIADFDKAIEIDPSISGYWRDRALAKRQMNDGVGALTDFDRAIELAPRDDLAFAGRGDLKASKGDLDGALKDYDVAIGLGSSNARPYHSRGWLRHERGDAEGALVDLKKAHELDPKNTAILQSLAVIQKDQVNMTAAIENCNRVLELSPTAIGSYFTRALAKSETEDWKGAIADFRRYSEVDSRRRAYAGLFVWILRAKHGEGAAADAELVAQQGQSPTDDWPRQIGRFLVGQIDEAELSAAAAMGASAGKDGQLCELRYYTGMKRLLAGDRKEARERFQKCLETVKKSFVEYKWAQAELKKLDE